MVPDSGPGYFFWIVDVIDMDEKLYPLVFHRENNFTVRTALFMVRYLCRLLFVLLNRRNGVLRPRIYTKIPRILILGLLNV